MSIWTRDSMMHHRDQMGWPQLSDDLNNQVVDILNDALEILEPMQGMSWVEPEIRFLVKNQDS